MNLLFRGVWSSVMATSSMTMAMFEAHKHLPEDEKSPLPPAVLTQDVQEKTSLDFNTSPELQEELTMISHYGYGALGGIVYAALAAKSKTHPVIKGSLFGLSVWAGSYFGLIPGLNLTPSAAQMTKKRNLMMALAHIAWGASLGFAEQELRQKGQKLLDGKSGQQKFL